jgi:hypothetical protein
MSLEAFLLSGDKHMSEKENGPIDGIVGPSPVYDAKSGRGVPQKNPESEVSPTSDLLFGQCCMEHCPNRAARQL